MAAKPAPKPMPKMPIMPGMPPKGMPPKGMPKKPKC